ncbi:hypothetical protein KCU87_g160, partial [Aureobasidium melanogenum]
MFVLRGAAPPTAVLRAAAAGIARAVVGAGAGASAVNGDFGRAAPLAGVLRKGELVRLMPGVPVREGGLLGRLMVGLSHEEKKSSSSPAGVLVPLAPASSARSYMALLQFGISLAPPCQLLLVFVGGIGSVFCLGVLASESGRATMALEILGCRLVTADLEVGWGMWRVGLRTVEVGGTDEGDVDTEISVATYLVGLLLLQLLEDLLRLSLGSKRHVDARVLYNQTRGCVVRGRVLKTALHLGHSKFSR